jgi:hypothetical protein
MLSSYDFNSGAFAVQNFEDTFKIQTIIRSCLQSSVLWYLQDSITYLYSPTENQCETGYALYSIPNLFLS